MSAFVRYPLLGCLALSLIACGSSGSQTLLSLDGSTAGPTPEAMRGAILDIYQATTQVTTTSSYRVLGSGSGTLGSPCNGAGADLTCTRYEDTEEGINIESAHKADSDSGEAPEGFGTSFRSLGTSQGVQLGTITATATTGTDEDVTVTTTYHAGWLQFSFFAVVLDSFDDSNGNQRIGTAFSQGEATTTNPTALDGYDLTWKGVLLGLGHTSDSQGGVTRNNRIRGDVEIGITNSAVDVTFSNLVDLNNRSNDQRLNDDTVYDWTWTGLSLSNGSFSDSTVNGQFYGDDHMEVGGTFDRHGAIGAFGAKRMKSTP